MPFGIVVTLDDTTESFVREIWASFEKHRIGMTPGTFNEPPHISLAGGIEADVAVLKEILNRIQVNDVGIRISPYGIFKGKSNSVYLKADPSISLKASHVALYEMLESKNITFEPLYAPNNIIFHCTIAVEVDDSRLEMASALMENWPETVEATAKTIQLFKYFPVELISRRLLVDEKTK